MKTTKDYTCELCDRVVKIRSTIRNKDSEFYGKKVCNGCAAKHRVKKVSNQTRQTQRKRAEARKDYPEFFKAMIEKYRGKKCMECGDILRGFSTEIAHIISKSTNPEVATNPDNILSLCADCHTRFDSNLAARKKMKCIMISLEKYLTIRPLIQKMSGEVIFYENLTSEILRE